MRKYQAILDTLSAQIAAGRYDSVKRFPSEMELASRFKVSRPTAGRAIRELQQRGILERRAGSGTYLRRAHPPSPTREFGLLVPGLGNTEILDPICNEITRSAQAQQTNVLFGNGAAGDTSPDRAIALAQLYIDRKVAGVFFAPLEAVPDRQEINLRIVDQLSAAGIAVVLLDRDVLDFPRRSGFDLVGIDNFQAGYVLADHLASVGHRRFAFVARPGHPSTTDLRIAGCRDALAHHDLLLARDAVHFGDPADAEFARSIVDRNYDVAVCANDRTAAMMIQTLSSLGVRLPDDVAVVGFDDVRYATLLSVPLTTMRQPCEQIGQTAWRIMTDRLSSPTLPARQVLLTAELVIRQSSGRGA